VTDIVLHPAESLHGRLQRGRGCAARRAAGTPGSGDLVYDCVFHDPRWDTLEDRGLYYARLVCDLELGLGPFLAHLFDPVDHVDTDEDRTNLAVDVLGRLVRLGRLEAAPPLRRYAREGANWYAALAELVDLDDPTLAEGLDEVAAARCDDQELAWLCGVDGAVTRKWAARHPRIAAARRPEVRPYEPRTALAGRTDDDLAALARGHGEEVTPAILELGRRRSPVRGAAARRRARRTAVPRRTRPRRAGAPPRASVDRGAPPVPRRRHRRARRARHRPGRPGVV
jgi:hypothetical protein